MVGIDVLTILEVAPLVTLLVAYLKIEFVFVFVTNTLQFVFGVSAVAPPVAGSTPAFPYTVLTGSGRLSAYTPIYVYVCP